VARHIGQCLQDADGGRHATPFVPGRSESPAHLFGELIKGIRQARSADEEVADLRHASPRLDFIPSKETDDGSSALTLRNHPVANER
jgi:hypothetical protein